MRISDWSSDVCSSDLSFNYETRDVYEIKIRSDDPYEYIEQTFFIEVTDVNDLPSNPNVESITIPEDYPINTAIVGGTFDWDDEDGDGISYFLTNNHATFKIVQVNGQGVLQLSNRLDFESTKYFLLQMVVQDTRGGTVESTIPVNVTDVNEAPTEIKLTCATITCFVDRKSVV